MSEPYEESISSFNSGIEICRWRKHIRRGEYFEARNSAIVIWFHLRSGGDWPSNVSAGLFKEFMQLEGILSFLGKVRKWGRARLCLTLFNNATITNH